MMDVHIVYANNHLQLVPSFQHLHLVKLLQTVTMIVKMIAIVQHQNYVAAVDFRQHQKLASNHVVLIAHYSNVTGMSLLNN